VRGQVLVRELPVPGVGHDPSAWHELLAPRVGGAVQAAAGRVFPLGLGGQPLAGPGGVGQCVLQPDMHHRVQVPAVQGGARAVRVTPVGAGHPAPPLGPVGQRHRPRGGGEDLRPGHQERRVGAGEIARIGRGLGDGHVPGVGHEPAERGVGDRVIIDPHALHLGGGDRSFLRVKGGATHPEDTAGNQGHALASHDPTGLTVVTRSGLSATRPSSLTSRHELPANLRPGTANSSV